MKLHYEVRRDKFVTENYEFDLSKAIIVFDNENEAPISLEELLNALNNRITNLEKQVANNE